MIKELRRVSLGILVMFGLLFASTTVIQVFQTDNLRVDPRNVRTLYASYSAERGSIIVGNTAIAQSVPIDDVFKYQRTYEGGGLYSAITGYFTINQGLSGLELAMNDELSGQSNSQFFDQVLALVTGKSPRGASVKLTINAAVQQAARDAMGDLSGAAIALNPKTGEIYALVSTPSYDPNTLATHDTESAVSQFNDLLNSSNSPLSNRAIAGTLYHPGSVFKLVVAAAALDSGTLTTSSELPNPATLQLPQSTAVINNSNDGPCGSSDPTVTMVTALQYSCNIPFAEIGQLVGERTLQDYAEAFGFGATIEIPMAATRSTFPSGMDDAQLMVSSFGQFDVRVSPLQMAMVTSAIANGGVLMHPTVVDSVLAADLRPLREFESTVYSTPITPATADSLVRMMVLSVDSGVASNARIPGVSVAGKTGTAENGDGEPYTLWFTGFAPSDNPEVVVAVVIENGGGLGQSGSGNAIAAPIARKIIEAVLAR
jgi:peptidoglycan glycosyltransferase